MPGKTITRENNAYISAGETLRPLGDKLFIRPLDFQPSAIIDCIREGRPVRGKVVFAGKGEYLKIKSKDRSKFFDTETFIKNECKPGDIVEFGGLNIFDGRGYIFDEIVYGVEKLLIISEKDVCFINEQ